ncbi:hypothetical protein, partial [Gallaecimonas pentaromativorans]|uniref:hypothetical protein n=1 Tax=Gallaecimonas pentaromativorans TaxID=584787 RepID=UPI001B8780BD
GMATHVLVRRPCGTVLRTSKRRFPTRLSPGDGVLIAMLEQSAKPVALCAALATARLQKWRWLFALASCIAMKAVPSRDSYLAGSSVPMHLGAVGWGVLFVAEPVNCCCICLRGFTY